MKQITRTRINVSTVFALTVLKRIIVGAILLFVGWIGYEILARNIMHGSRFDQAVAFITIWVISAYVIIPHIHRVLTKLYIPDYFIGRIRTADGLLGDPVNLAFIGSDDQLHEAMKAAGWTMADDLTIKSGVRMIFDTLLRRSNSRAPVSSGFLFQERQNFTYQQNIKGRPLARHHVRFWKVPDGWLMPGGYKVDWLAAGTFDRSVGLSYFTFQITHRIESDTDIERDHIVKTLESSVKLKNVTVIKNYFSAYHHRNGGGDSIQTDGALPIIEL